jgi:hypothetical protein
MKFWQQAQRESIPRHPKPLVNAPSYCAVLVVFFGNVGINNYGNGVNGSGVNLTGN